MALLTRSCLGSMYASLLLRCTANKALEQGKRVHSEMMATGHDRHVYLGNLLIEMYGICGSLEDARAAFDRLEETNVVSWNILIAAYTKDYGGDDQLLSALELLCRMHLLGVKCNTITLTTALRACTALGSECSAAVKAGKCIHACCRELDTIFSASLVNMYVKWGWMKEAEDVFFRCKPRHSTTWNIMLAAYAQSGRTDRALQLFATMQSEGVRPDRFTCSAVASAATSVAQACQIHGCARALGVERETIVGTAIVNMYGKCGSLEHAKAVFDAMDCKHRDVIAWNAMVAAAAYNRQDVVQYLEMMKQAGVKPNNVTFITLLNACDNLEQGKRIVRSAVVKNGCDEVGEFGIGYAVLNMYARCGSLEDARDMFDRMGAKGSRLSLASWNTMLTAYCLSGQATKTLDLFHKMDLQGEQADCVSYVAVLDACASLSALAAGRLNHARSIASGCSGNVVVLNTIVHMYASCGGVDAAKQVFDSMDEHPGRTLASWNAMIAGYSHNGHNCHALSLFEQLKLEGMRPDGFTWTSILNACSHGGLLSTARHHFVSMSEDWGLTPLVAHYGCMIDLFGRIGSVEQADDLITAMPFYPDVMAWMSFLGTCRTHGNLAEATERAPEGLLDRENDTSSLYSLVSNMLATEGG